MKKKRFTKSQVDILREIGNICAGNATIALSQILFKKIELQIPVVEIISVKKIGEIFTKQSELIIGIQMETLGAINGQILLIFPQKSAYTLMELLVGNTKRQKAKLITQIGISSLKEIGNIVISSYLSTLSSLSRLPVFPSCPQFTDGLSNNILRAIFGGFGKKGPDVIFIETIFKEDTSSLTGKFFIAFDSVSMKLILKACELGLKNFKK